MHLGGHRFFLLIRLDLRPFAHLPGGWEGARFTSFGAAQTLPERLLC